MAQAVLTPLVREHVSRECRVEVEARRINWQTVFLTACALIVAFQVVRAAVRFEHWAWMVK